MILHFTNARLIDPEADSDAPGSLTVEDGVITARDGKARQRAPRSSIAAANAWPPASSTGASRSASRASGTARAFRSAGLAAAAGGVTTIIARPDTLPAIDTPEMLEFVTRRAAESAPVRIRHMAALTKGRDGREMTEIGFLLDAGAIAFTDVFAVVHRHQGAGARADLCPLSWRAGRRPPAGTGPVEGCRHHLWQIRLAARAACRLGPGRADGAGARSGLGRDDRRALSRRSDHHRRRPARAGPRQGGGAGCHRRHLDPPSDAERIRRRRLSHLLQAHAAPARPKTTGWR